MYLQNSNTTKNTAQQKTKETLGIKLIWKYSMCLMVREKISRYNPENSKENYYVPETAYKPIKNIKKYNWKYLTNYLKRMSNTNPNKIYLWGKNW